jgi:hypothetical protein
MAPATHRVCTPGIHSSGWINLPVSVNGRVANTSPSLLSTGMAGVAWTSDDHVPRVGAASVDSAEITFSPCLAVLSDHSENGTGLAACQPTLVPGTQITNSFSSSRTGRGDFPLVLTAKPGQRRTTSVFGCSPYQPHRRCCAGPRPRLPASGTGPAALPWFPIERSLCR